MTDYSEETRAEFMTRPDVHLPAIGPDRETTDQVIDLMVKFAAELEHDPQIGKDAYATPVVSFLTHWGYEGKRYVEGPVAKISVIRETKKSAFRDRETNFTVLLDEDIDNGEMLRLSITPDGYITNIDNPDEPFEDKDILLKGLDILEDKLSDRRDERQRDVERRRRRIKNTVLTGLAISAVAGFATAGVKYLWLDPRAEAEKARNLYDSEQHTLPGQGDTVNPQVIPTIPNKEFMSIPEFSDNDSLTSPRRVTVQGDTCTSLDAKAKPGQSLYVVTGDESILEGSTIDTAIGGEDKIVLCIFGRDTQNEDADPYVAIQIRNEQQDQD